jgi:hypothetical protein
MSRIADYTIITSNSFSLGNPVTFPINVPAGFHKGSRCVLRFNLGSIKGNDYELRLRVRINGTLVYSYNSTATFHGFWTVQRVVPANVLNGDGRDQIQFSREIGDEDSVLTRVLAKLSTVVLSCQVDTEEGLPYIVRIGGDGDDGQIRVFPSNVANGSSPGKASIWLKGQTAYLGIGGGPSSNSRDGDLVLKGGVKKGPRITLSAQSGPQATSIIVGGLGASGQIYLVPLWESHNASNASIHLNGATGTITAANVDCAEDFEIDDVSSVEPGTVMVIGEGLRLRASDQAYDKRVAGIVSGAGDYRPGIILGRRPGGDSQKLPIALMGRVFCKVDADQSPVRVGDLLTTSAVRGHAMKVGDPARAFGAVIGKALGPLESGRGTIPVLVALQ